MLTIPGYKLTEKLYQSNKSLIFRGECESDGRHVVLKVLQREFPTPEEIARFKQEYAIMKNLNFDGVLKSYDMEDFGSNFVLILEDFNGISLKEVINQKKSLDLRTFLDTAIRLADIVSKLHTQNVIHKDIKPLNILINQNTHEVKITDFGISAVISEANEAIYHPDTIEGTLAYMSPEQTGRINRKVDYRSDLYSLGVTFYEMLTGQVPFLSKDALETIHMQIAKTPTPPNRINSDIPEAVSNIVMKLLEKSVELRYQSATGLSYDLHLCQDQYKMTGTISNFQPGERDLSLRFSIPDKLFGRTEELRVLLESFERAAKGRPEMTLVAGYSGIGKSALINEIQLPIVACKGYFVSGKFDQFRRNVPFSAFIQALKSFTTKILGENEDSVRAWKEELLHALGSNGQVIIDVAPEVELIIGPQPALPQLGPEESQNRFNAAFRNFLGVITSAEHPLALFLDDMQWADRASLTLLKTIITEQSLTNFFIVLAYRDNEVSPSHPFMVTLEEIKESGTIVNLLTLKPLQLENVNELVAASCQTDLEQTKPLALQVQGKTNGNPFFVKQFLTMLAKDKLLRYEGGAGWSWNLKEIQNLHASDNVVDLMMAKLNKFPEEIRTLLTAGACMGNYFDLLSLSHVLNRPLEDTYRALRILLEEGYCFRQGEEYHFAHDRIQEAAYNLREERERIIYHYRAGRFLLEAATEDSLPKKIFNIVNQLNSARSIIRNGAELQELARLNLQAGRLAKSSSAFSSAVEYLNAGIESLPENSWQDLYELTFPLYFEKSESLYMASEHEEAEQLFEYLLDNTSVTNDRSKIYTLKIVLYTNRHHILEAIDVGREALANLYNIKLPDKPGQFTILKEVLKLKLKMKKNTEELYNLPEMTNPDMKNVMTLMMELAPASYFSDAGLLVWIFLRMVQYSIQYGNCEHSAYGYMGYGIALVSPGMQDYKQARDMAILSLRLNEKFGLSALWAKLYHISGGIVSGWRIPYQECLDSLRKAYDYGVENGDIAYAVYALQVNSQIKMSMGKTVHEIQQDMNRYWEFLEFSDDRGVLGHFESRKRYLQNLRGETYAPNSFSSDEFNEEEYVSELNQTANLYALALYNTYKSQSLYFAELHEEALEQTYEAEKYMAAATGMSVNFDYRVIRGLTLAQVYTSRPKNERQKLLKEMEVNLKQLQIWAVNCPVNFEAGYLLARAEYFRVKQENNLKTMQTYNQAYLAAEKAKSILYRAMCDERTAEFYYESNYISIGKPLMERAIREYARWGNVRKENLLGEKYPELLDTGASLSDTLSNSLNEPISRGAIRRKGEDPGASSVLQAAGPLDLSSLIKSTQAISSEINLDRVQDKMMRILLENTGAITGLLLLKDDEDMKVEAFADLNKDRVEVIPSVPFEHSEDLPRSVIRYVLRTRESVLLGDAAQDQRFLDDPYLISRKTKSVICSPIFSQGRITGVIYLENSLTPNTFTRDRLEVLQTLSSQAAISMDNARLYARLEDKVKKRTKDLTNSLEKIRQLKNQQDGDYFLTTMITSPLFKNANHSRMVSTNFRIEQKKSFVFKKWSGQLGGDICVTGNLDFNGSPHTVFLNGDAMGKSMQGAGGSIVMGTVMNSLLSRYVQKGRSVITQTPEEWLQEVHEELNHIFLSFEGAMSISCVIGLVEENTGRLIYFNAEHPFSVLYRNGKAQFLENTVSMPKLGIAQTEFKCLHYQLEPEDVLLIGSDGKDDLILKNNSDNSQKTDYNNLNQNDELFLEIVEESRADLDQIFNRLRSSGEFIDDCSVIRVGYREATFLQDFEEVPVD